ncbi:MAG: hypothetical protein ACLFNU_01300 [Bacteroidales bacterium]
MISFLLSLNALNILVPKLATNVAPFPTNTWIGYAGILVLLAILGYFRSATTNQMPSFILDQKKIQEDWQIRSQFTTILLPIMGLLIFIFNAFAWGVYGLVSIIEFFAFLFTSLWWVISWIWFNFLHPVVFFIVKLLWHYIIIWSWRFFKIAITRIPEAYSLSTIKNGFLSVFSISFMVLLLFYLGSIMAQPWIYIVIVFAFLFGIVFFSIYTLYNDPERTFNEFWTGTVVSKFAIIVTTSIVSIAVIIALHLFAGTAVQIPVLGTSFPIAQLLTILFIITFITSVFANTIMPAYMYENNGVFETKDFLISTGLRLPRLIGAAPFVLLGGAIASIATVLIGSLLWWSTNTTKEIFCERALDKLNTELNEEQTVLRKTISSKILPRQAHEITKDNTRRIAILESRIFSLNQFKNDWLAILQNLPEGYRRTTPYKNNIKLIEQDYKRDKEKITNAIDEAETKLAELTTKHEMAPDNINLEKRVERERERINDFKTLLNKTEVERIVSISMENERVRSTKATNVMWILGTLFSLIGYALLIAIVLTPFWVYRTKVYFDLYTYHHEGKSYLTEQIEFYKERNRNQPLLGFFVLLIIILISLAVSFGWFMMVA